MKPGRTHYDRVRIGWGLHITGKIVRVLTDLILDIGGVLYLQHLLSISVINF